MITQWDRDVAHGLAANEISVVPESCYARGAAYGRRDAADELRQAISQMELHDREEEWFWQLIRKWERGE